MVKALAFVGFVVLNFANPALSIDVQYSALSRANVRSAPVDVWPSLNIGASAPPLACAAGEFNTECVIPEYTRAQAQRFLSGAFFGEDLIHSRDVMGRIRSIIAEEAKYSTEARETGKENSSIEYGLRQVISVYKRGPLPIFPSSFFEEIFLQTSEADVRAFPDFQNEKFLQAIRSISLNDFGSEESSFSKGTSALLPLESYWPVSYEKVGINEVTAEAWQIWERLAQETDTACTGPRLLCRTSFVVLRFTNGPSPRRRGYAVCNFNQLAPSFLSNASNCTVVAFENDAAQRYVKVAYGPLVSLERGGPIGAAGVIEMQCGLVSGNGRRLQIVRQDVTTALRASSLGLSVPDSARYGNPRRLISALNNGNRVSALDGKFAFLQVDIDLDDEEATSVSGLSLRVMARAHRRAEANPGLYPVVSIPEANVIARSLMAGFRSRGYDCSVYNDQ